jgi:hypothetical protein
MKRPKGTPPRNMAASVKAKLMGLAKERNEDFNFILNRYVLDRLLYRLAASPHAGKFLLKGAMLFTVWSRQPKRSQHPGKFCAGSRPPSDLLRPPPFDLEPPHQLRELRGVKLL